MSCSAAFLPNRVSLRDLLLYADAAMPEASELDGYAKTVSLTVSQNEDGSQVRHLAPSVIAPSVVFHDLARHATGGHHSTAPDRFPAQP